MRLFAAVDPPDDAVADLERSLRRKGTDWRWVPTAQSHITTAFYGEVGAERAEGLRERLERAATRTAPLSLQITGAGCFPRHPDAARALWAGLAGDLDELSRLADRSEPPSGRSATRTRVGSATRRYNRWYC